MQMKSKFLLAVVVGLALCSRAHTSNLIQALRTATPGESLNRRGQHLAATQNSRPKRVLVTGGRTGIGLGIVLNALMHAADGSGPQYHIIITSTDPESAAEVSRDLMRQFEGSTIESLYLEITDEGSIKQVVDVVKENGGVDILVNNAGSYDNDPELQMNIHYHGTKVFTDAMLSRNAVNPNGKIIFVMSKFATFRNLQELNPAAYATLSRYRQGLTFQELDQVYQQYIADLRSPDQRRHDRWLHENSYAMYIFKRIYAFLVSRLPAILKNNIQVYSSDPGWTRTGLDRNDECKYAPLSIEEGGSAAYHFMTLRDDIDMSLQGEDFGPDFQMVA